MQNHEGPNASLIGAPMLFESWTSSNNMLAGFTTDCSSLFVFLASFLICKSHIPLQITEGRRKPKLPLNYGWAMFPFSILNLDLFFPPLLLNQQ